MAHKFQVLNSAEKIIKTRFMVLSKNDPIICVFYVILGSVCFLGTCVNNENLTCGDILGSVCFVGTSVFIKYLTCGDMYKY